MDIANIYLYSTSTGQIITIYQIPILLYLYVLTVMLTLFCVAILYKLYKS